MIRVIFFVLLFGGGTAVDLGAAGFVDKNGNRAPNPCIEGARYYHKTVIGDCRKGSFSYWGCKDKATNKEYEQNEIEDKDNLRKIWCQRTGTKISSTFLGCVTDDGDFINETSTVKQDNGVKFTCFRNSTGFQFEKHQKRPIPDKCSKGQTRVEENRYNFECLKNSDHYYSFRLVSCMATPGNQSTAVKDGSTTDEYEKDQFGFRYMCRLKPGNHYAFETVGCLYGQTYINPGSVLRISNATVICKRKKKHLRITPVYDGGAPRRICTENRVFVENNYQIECKQGQPPRQIGCVFFNNKDKILKKDEIFDEDKSYRYKCLRPQPSDSSPELALAKIACLDDENNLLEPQDQKKLADGSRIFCKKSADGEDLERSVQSAPNPDPVETRCQNGDSLIQGYLQYQCQNSEFKPVACAPFKNATGILEIGQTRKDAVYGYSCQKKNDTVNYEAVSCLDNEGVPLQPGEARKVNIFTYSCKVKADNKLQLVVGHANGCKHPTIPRKLIRAGNFVSVARSINQLHYSTLHQCVLKNGLYQLVDKACVVNSQQYKIDEFYSRENDAYQCVDDLSGLHLTPVPVENIGCKFENQTYKNGDEFKSATGVTLYKCHFGEIVKQACEVHEKRIPVGQTMYCNNEPYFCPPKSDGAIRFPFNGCPLADGKSVKIDEKMIKENIIYTCSYGVNGPGVYFPVLVASGCQIGQTAITLGGHAPVDGKTYVCKAQKLDVVARPADAEEMECIKNTRSFDCLQEDDDEEEDDSEGGDRGDPKNPVNEPEGGGQRPDVAPGTSKGPATAIPDQSSSVTSTEPTQRGYSGPPSTVSTTTATPKENPEIGQHPEKAEDCPENEGGDDCQEGQVPKTADQAASDDDCDEDCEDDDPINNEARDVPGSRPDHSGAEPRPIDGDPPSTGGDIGNLPPEPVKEPHLPAESVTSKPDHEGQGQPPIPRPQDDISRGQGIDDNDEFADPSNPQTPNPTPRGDVTSKPDHEGQLDDPQRPPTDDISRGQGIDDNDDFPSEVYPPPSPVKLPLRPSSKPVERVPSEGPGQRVPAGSSDRLPAAGGLTDAEQTASIRPTPNGPRIPVGAAEQPDDRPVPDARVPAGEPRVPVAVDDATPTPGGARVPAGVDKNPVPPPSGGGPRVPAGSEDGPRPTPQGGRVPAGPGDQPDDEPRQNPTPTGGRIPAGTGETPNYPSKQDGGPRVPVGSEKQPELGPRVPAGSEKQPELGPRVPAGGARVPVGADDEAPTQGGSRVPAGIDNEPDSLPKASDGPRVPVGAEEQQNLRPTADTRVSAGGPRVPAGADEIPRVRPAPSGDRVPAGPANEQNIPPPAGGPRVPIGSDDLPQSTPQGSRVPAGPDNRPNVNPQAGGPRIPAGSDAEPDRRPKSSGDRVPVGTGEQPKSGNFDEQPQAKPPPQGDRVPADSDDGPKTIPKGGRIPAGPENQPDSVPTANGGSRIPAGPDGRVPAGSDSDEPKTTPGGGRIPAGSDNEPKPTPGGGRIPAGPEKQPDSPPSSDGSSRIPAGSDSELKTTPSGGRVPAGPESSTSGSRQPPGSDDVTPTPGGGRIPAGSDSELNPTPRDDNVTPGPENEATNGPVSPPGPVGPDGRAPTGPYDFTTTPGGSRIPAGPDNGSTTTASGGRIPAGPGKQPDSPPSSDGGGRIPAGSDGELKPTTSGGRIPAGSDGGTTTTSGGRIPAGPEKEATTGPESPLGPVGPDGRVPAGSEDVTPTPGGGRIPAGPEKEATDKPTSPPGSRIPAGPDGRVPAGSDSDELKTTPGGRIPAGPDDGPTTTASGGRIPAGPPGGEPDVDPKCSDLIPEAICQILKPLCVKNEQIPASPVPLTDVKCNALQEQCQSRSSASSCSNYFATCLEADSFDPETCRVEPACAPQKQIREVAVDQLVTALCPKTCQASTCGDSVDPQKLIHPQLIQCLLS